MMKPAITKRSRKNLISNCSIERSRKYIGANRQLYCHCKFCNELRLILQFTTRIYYFEKIHQMDTSQDPKA